MGGGETISTSEPRLRAISVQSSIYGLALPILYGRTRVSGNLLGYYDFTATANTTVTAAGGKGGGGGAQSSTTYTYDAAVLMGLCEGPIIGVPSVWRGKKRYVGGLITPAATGAEETLSVASSQSVTVSQAAFYLANSFVILIGDPASSASDITLNYGMHYLVADGIYTFDPSIAAGSTVRIAYTWQAPATYTDALAQLNLGLADGSAAQPPWAYLLSRHPAEALGYSSTAYVYGAQYELASSAALENHTFEVDGKFQFGISGIADANPKEVLTDLLTNPQYGANFPAANLGDLTNYSDYCVSHGFFVSPAYNEQAPAQQHIQELMQLTNSAVVWSENLLKIIPYGDEAANGNGATYTPNLTPIYDLNDDHFICSQGEDPVTCDRKTPADAFNQVQVEYLDRSKDYNLAIAEAKDLANIEKFGLRPQEPLKMHGICDMQTARSVAQIVLQRTLYVRNEYEFQLGWNYALLEPMDLVTLTDAGLGLNKTPVRIISIEEGESDSTITVRAEDYPFGVASATLYPSQVAAGYGANYNAAPGNVAAPVFFEPPIELTATGLEVWCAVSGLASPWGGCNVWASLDGNTYKQVSTVNGGARYGQTMGALSTAANATLPVSLAGLGGQLLAGTAQDAALLNTLAWVGTPAGGEFLAYETAALTGANAYSLGGLVRGAYASGNAAHASGSQFVRVDQAIAKGEPLDLSLVGTTIYFKFCSFNVWGGGLQQLAEVIAYPYAITGSMLKLPPSPVLSMAAVIEEFGVRLTWPAIADQDLNVYEIRYGGTTWATSTYLEQTKATSYLWKMQVAGTRKVWIKAVDLYANYSTTAASTDVSIAPPAAPIFSRVETEENVLKLQWQDCRTSQALKQFNYRVGTTADTWATATDYGSDGGAQRVTIIVFATPGTKRVFVTAQDVGDNLSTPAFVDLTVNLPTNYVLAGTYPSAFAGTGTNTALPASGGLLMLTPNQTWAQHFATNGYANTGDQVIAGQPLFFQPSTSTAQYVETFDLGTVLSSATISFTTQAQWLAGTGTITPTVSYRALPTDPWTDAVGSFATIASNFRYFKITINVTGAGTANLYQLQTLVGSVSLRTVTEALTFTSSAGDATGTLYVNTRNIVDITSASFVANGTIAPYTDTIQDDSVYPARVRVKAWDASLNRVTVQGTLTITGTAS